MFYNIVLTELSQKHIVKMAKNTEPLDPPKNTVIDKAMFPTAILTLEGEVQLADR